MELDVQYAMVLSSNAGLWGYDIGDSIKFVSLNPFRIVVTGRIKHFTSAFGENVIAEEVEGAIGDAMKERGGVITEFHVAPQVSPSDGLPFHEWFIEFQELPADLEAFASVLNQSVMERNPYYSELIAGSILRPVVLHPLPGGAFHLAMEVLGRLGGQNKPPRLANDRKFAEALCQIEMEVR